MHSQRALHRHCFILSALSVYTARAKYPSSQLQCRVEMHIARHMRSVPMLFQCTLHANGAVHSACVVYNVPQLHL